MPKIIINHPDGTQAKYGLNGKVFTVGRAENNDIVLRDGSSSGHHAVLKLTESGDFAVTDLESTNHTRVNGVRVSTRRLVDGDVIQFADTQAIYESELAGMAVPVEAPPLPAAVPAAPAAVRAVQPYPIQRPVSTMGGGRRRSRSGGGDGCFALLAIMSLLPLFFLGGLLARHMKESRGQSIVQLAREAMRGK